MKIYLLFLLHFAFCFNLFGEHSADSSEQVAYLGIYTIQVDPNLSHQLKLPVNLYLSVQKVEKGSPAEKSGIQQYDLLLQFDDQILINQEQLKHLVRYKKAGDEVILTFLRRGVKRSSKLILGGIPKTHDSIINETINNDPFLDRNPLGLNGFLPNDSNLRELIQRHSFRKMPNLNRNYGQFRHVKPENDSDEDPLHQTSVKDSFSHQSTNSQVMVSDKKGTLELIERDGQKSLRATDPNGKVVFDGSIDTDEERKTLSPELMTRLKGLEKNIKSP